MTDSELPSITCPANIGQNVASGTWVRVGTYTSPVGSDNCSGPITLQTAGLANGATFPVGTTTNTFRVTDAAGNTATCSFTVIITDNELPSITCPANVSQNVTSGTCGRVVTLPHRWVQTIVLVRQRSKQRVLQVELHSRLELLPTPSE
ncbi:MAG: HYR domain-containing protein [Saprospiraceae bacterium]|nr:HYR domain-containing protein [Saprospiraceae bacterium]